jgi:hypothetical protein
LDYDGRRWLAEQSRAIKIDKSRSASQDCQQQNKPNDNRQATLFSWQGCGGAGLTGYPGGNLGFQSRAIKLIGYDVNFWLVLIIG